jgi:hypothetical protein
VETTRVPAKTAAAVAALFLALGVASGILMGARRAAESTPTPVLSPTSESVKRSSPASEGASTPPPTAPRRKLPKELAERPTGPQTLTDRLERLRKILVEKAKAGHDRSDLDELDRDILEGWQELHQAVLKDPAGYFAFLRSTGSDVVCDRLLDVLCVHPTMGHRDWIMNEMPPAVLEGIVDLLGTGDKARKLAAARFARDLLRSPGVGKRDVVLEPCLSLLSSDDPRAQAVALDVLQLRRPAQLEESLDLVQALWKKSDETEVRLPCLSALALMKSPAAEQILFERASEILGDHLQKPYDPLGTSALDHVRGRILAGKPGDDERYGDLLLTAVRSAKDPLVFHNCVGTSLDLPLPKARSVLEQAYASAPTPETKAYVRRVLDLMESGEVRPDRLRAVALQGPHPH